MNMPFYVLNPAALLLLVALPFFVLRWRMLRTMGQARRWTALCLRLLVALLLILGVAQVQFIGRTDILSVIFAADLSESIPTQERQQAFETIKVALDEMGHNDRAGVVVFGKDAVLDAPVQPYLDWERPSSLLNTGGTGIASGLRLSLAAFPVESQKRVALISDGNENRGSALEESKKLAGLGIPVDVFPLEYSHEAEVYVEKIVHPHLVNEDEPLDFEVFVNSRQPTAARIRLFLEDQLVRDQPVQLVDGKNKFTVHSLRLPSSQISKIEVRVEAEADTSSENNRATGFVNVLGKPNILLVEGDLETNLSAADEFVAQLQSEGIRVRRLAPKDLSAEPSQVLGYDAVVLSNVEASDLPATQMRNLEKAVHDLGVGLVMIGGPKSFGAGGYKGTAIEEALPVRMDIKERKVLPSGALALVLHTCEIPAGNDWMRKIALESIRVLDPHDEVGMLDFERGRVQWIFSMGPKGDGQRQAALIKSAVPGDMPDFESAMRLGYNGLRAVTSNLRHMVILSDGDPNPPTTVLLEQFAKAEITVSTVLIGGHGGNFRPVMQSIARATGGRFHEVDSPSHLPRIFAREAASVKRNLVVEETFQPQPVFDTELTEDFDPEGYPPLLGYVITTPKSGAEIPLITHQEDPLLAHWRYGLGKSIAFTSDFKKKWAPRWIEWARYGRFWAQAIRWVSRQRMEGNHRLSVFQEEGKGRVVLDSFDDDGNPLNFLDFEGRAIAPNQEVIPLRLVQTDLGRYEAELDLAGEGTYLVNLFRIGEDGTPADGVISAGLSVPYSPEYSNDRSNTNLLRQIAASTGGRYTPDVARLFDHSLVAHTKPIPLWPWLLGTAMILFWFDVFVRRVLVDWGDFRNGAAAVRRFLFPEKTATRAETLERLKDAKESTLADVGAKGEPLAKVERRFDFDSLEKRTLEQTDLSLPQGRKAAPSKREAEPTSEDHAADREASRSTARLLDLKKRLEKKE